MNNHHRNQVSRWAFSVLTVFAAIPLLFLLVLPVAATEYHWTNHLDDGDYTNPLNWDPEGLPQTTDYTSDVVVFGEKGGTPHTVTRTAYASPSWATAANLLHVRFDNAGWTLNAPFSIVNLRTLTSYGDGTNMIDFYFNTRDSRTWTIGPDNTLYLAQSFYCRNYTMTVKGGGLLWLSGAFSGFGSGSYGLRVQDATLRVSATQPSSIGRVWLDSTAARLQLQTTVANAQSQIGTRIFDDVGNGLTVTDIGDGYVEVAVYVEVPAVGTVLTVF